MKKLSLLISALLMFNLSAFAGYNEVVNADTINKAQNKIDSIGFKILNTNGIERRMTFNYDSSKTKNAYTAYSNREIVLYRGLYDRLKSDDEIAAVLSHEISHGIDSYNGIFKGYFSDLSYIISPKKYEYKADKRAVDFMVNAGYNPVAMIIMMNKVLPQTRYDWYSTHPLTSRRMMEVYEYIYKKYPEFLANNEYKNNLYYQNFLLNSKENRAKFQKKIEQKSKAPVHYL